MVASIIHWQLLLQGPVQLVSDRAELRVERRTAALLAYLALEGPSPRARLVGLLWPESSESAARTNLRQLLRRLRVAAGTDVVVGKEVLSLAPCVSAGEAGALLGRGRPLDGLDLDDAEALNEWIERTRRSLVDRRQLALLREHEEREASGDLVGALEAASEALLLDPYSEEAHRRLMRAHALRGDRAAALAAFEICREMLAGEFGVGPSEETAALAEELSRDAAPRWKPTPAAARVPLAVLRPPVFVGREREWSLMEQAWSAGRGVLLFGPPGCGKTRLMQEFLAHKGGAITFTGRPGDNAAPYGTHARTYRELIDAISPVELPEWVRAELARIIPSLGPAAPPLRNAVDKLRFFQAKLEVHRLAYARGLTALGFDDLQFVDPASVEAGHYVLSQLQLDRSTPVRTVHCFPTGSLNEEMRARLREAGFGEQFDLVELEPQKDAEVEALVDSLGLPALRGAGPRIASVAHGNPAAALAAVKHLLEQEDLDPVRLLEGKTQRLSELALQLARILAVLGPRFDFEVAGTILDKDPLALEPAWRELEAAQWVRGLRFSHRALAQTLVARIPEPTRALFSQRAAMAEQKRAAIAAS